MRNLKILTVFKSSTLLISSILIFLAILSGEYAFAASSLPEIQSKNMKPETNQITKQLKIALNINSKTIDLRPYTNCTLVDSFCPQNITNNNLEELPYGRQIFGGVPFEISGRVQLGCGQLAACGFQFPTQITNIKISAECTKIHLLHGAMFTQTNEWPIARLMLHYADGSTRRLLIIKGQHVLDWLGPLYKSGSNMTEPDVKASGSELAWSGKNSFLRSSNDSFSIRLYKSSLPNPQPAIKIEKIDYIASGRPVASFMLGLAVE